MRWRTPPFTAAVGTALAVVGAVSGSWWITVPAGIATVGALTVMVRVGSVRADLSGAFGVGWAERIPAQRRARMVSRWWTGPLPRTPQPRLRQDVAFTTVPGTDRVLRCDVWQPPVGVPPSGVAVAYLHGSAYYVFDKDFQTRPLFRHLAAQGHVVVDVAHRLFPETDVLGWSPTPSGPSPGCADTPPISGSAPTGSCSSEGRPAVTSRC